MHVHVVGVSTLAGTYMYMHTLVYTCTLSIYSPRG